MSDIFREVDEEVRREQLTKLWERYSIYVIALAILFVAAVAGWRGYQWWEAKQAAEAGSAFEAAIALSEQGKHADAEAAFAKIAVEGTTSYRALARLRAAAELAQGDPKAAIAAYDKLASDRTLGPVLQELAAVRAGFILVDIASFDEVRQRLEPFSGPESTFRHSARLLLALAAWRANDATAARRWFDMIMADNETPPSTRGQIEMLIALSVADDKN